MEGVWLWWRVGSYVGEWVTVVESGRPWWKVGGHDGGGWLWWREGGCSGGWQLWWRVDGCCVGGWLWWTMAVVVGGAEGSGYWCRVGGWSR